jgi:CubicO group peptidase (beta-lactamase class C family)
MRWYRLLALIGFAAIGAVPAFAQSDLSLASYSEGAEAILKPYVDANAFAGTVLVARKGEVLFEKAYGLANREWNVPNTIDTKFRIGSITKQFTATAILQLAEQGKLGVGDPVSKYYTDAPASWSKITLRNLLNHTSGIPDFTRLPNYETFMADDSTPLGIIQRVRDKPLDFPPGTKFAYDNTGYIVLGYVIEKVSQQSYADYIEKHIFEPLGMKDSGYDSRGAIPPHRAEGYYWKAEWRRPPYISMTLPFAAGGLYSTVGDLLVWDQALYADKPLRAKSLRQMFTPALDDYGFGWVITKDRGHRFIWHNGEINGFRSMISRYTDDHLTIIVLSNDQVAPVERMASDLAGLYFLDTGTKPTRVKLSSETLDAYQGQFKPVNAPVLTVARDGDGLTIAGANPPHPMYALGGDHFTLRTLPIDVTFTRDAAGKIVGLVVEADGKSTAAALVH